MLLSGHRQAQNVYRTQPAKMAALEAHYNTGPASLSLFGMPSSDGSSITANISIPGGLSYLIDGRADSPIIGLDRFRPEDRPPVRIAYTSYHLMIAIGIFFIVSTLAASWWRFRGSLFEKRWMMWLFVAAVVPAFIANQAGWVAAEVGRQPWIVYPPLQQNEDGEPLRDPQGYFRFDETLGLRTSDGISRAIHADQVLASILTFGAIYALLFVLWVYVLHQKISHGPEMRSVGVREPESALAVLDIASQLAGHQESLTDDE
jgi:cytochrome d ubiquinol oxidase subunit I